jgi:ABC-type glycerol-3-phosphate transport system substrate-binding protein
MWEDDGWSGTNIYEGIKNEDVYLSWMHQLDCLLIFGSEQLGIKSYLNNKEDLGVALMPMGVSFELNKAGSPLRTGSKKAHTSGWFWGIPKNAPNPELTYRLAGFITSHKWHAEECKNFGLIPVRKYVRTVLKENFETNWQNYVYATSLEQLNINGESVVPRFKTLVDYQEFLKDYYDAFEEIVIKRRYCLEGPDGSVERNFIRNYLR